MDNQEVLAIRKDLLRLQFIIGHLEICLFKSARTGRILLNNVIEKIIDICLFSFARLTDREYIKIYGSNPTQ